MKGAISAFCLLLCGTAMSFAKEKPKITIQVVDAQSSTRQYTYYVPGTNGHSETNCDSDATAIDLGGGMATANGTTNCTTTTTPGRSASTGVRYIPQMHVHAITPDGTHITLWCQSGFRRCDNPRPGNYTAEIDGNSVWLYGHDLSGKVHKTKYHYVGGW
jgi:hypothetical protein